MIYLIFRHGKLVPPPPPKRSNSTSLVHHVKFTCAFNDVKCLIHTLSMYITTTGVTVTWPHDVCSYNRYTSLRIQHTGAENVASRKGGNVLGQKMPT